MIKKTTNRHNKVVVPGNDYSNPQLVKSLDEFLKSWPSKEEPNDRINSR
jgi:hypothetical protein